MDLPDKELLRVLEEHAALPSPSCTMDARFYSSLSELLLAHFAQRYWSDGEVYRTEFKANYPLIAQKLEERVRKAG